MRGHAVLSLLTVLTVLTVLSAMMATGCHQRDAAEPQDAREREPQMVMSEQLPDHFVPHRRFSVTMGELRELLQDEREESRGVILQAPQAFLEDVHRLLLQEPDLLILVDKQHRLSRDYIPEDLVSLEEYRHILTLNRENMELRKVVMPSLLAMAEAARQDGITLDLSSTYRSYRYQEWLFQYWVDTIGLERAEQSSARPGASQHQLGTAIDFGSITGPFAEHPAGRWLAREAHRFGFSLSYPRGLEEVTGYIFEPWHFRYISPQGTWVEQRYFGGIQQFFLEFWHRHGATLRERWLPRQDHIP